MPCPNLPGMPGGTGHVRDTILLAHQGGWDEVLLLLVPLLIIGLLLALANRRSGD
jgi:hypothetical protein